MSRSLASALTRTTLTRAVSLTLGLTALVFLLQLVRALDRLPPGLGLDPALLAEIAVYTAPAVLTLTLPMALLVATGLTFGECIADGELAGWNALGRSTLRLVRGLVGAACAAAAIVAWLAGHVAPHALDRAGAALARHARTALTAGLDPTRAVELDDGIWLAARPGPTQDEPTLHDVIVHDPVRGLTLTTRRANLASGQAHLHDVELVSATGDSDCLSVRARALQLPGGEWDDPNAAEALVPAIERQSVPRLLEATSHGDTLARGQLVKRLVLVALPPLLVLLLLGLCSRVRALGRPDLGMLTALGLATLLHLTARGCELLARVGLASGLAMAAAVCVATAAVGLSALRAGR